MPPHNGFMMGQVKMCLWTNQPEGRPYTLRVQFDDDTEQTINFEPVLYGEVYGPLRDLTVFNQVRLDAETCTLVWPNDADFDPWVRHEWPRLVDKLAERAQLWVTEQAVAI